MRSALPSRRSRAVRSYAAAFLEQFVDGEVRHYYYDSGDLKARVSERDGRFHVYTPGHFLMPDGDVGVTQTLEYAKKLVESVVSDS